MSNKLESDGTYSLKCGLNSFISTYIVGILHPLDVIKTRIQSCSLLTKVTMASLGLSTWSLNIEAFSML